AITVWTSPTVKVPAVAFGATGGAIVPGVGTAPGSSGGPPPTWPTATRTRLLLAPLQLICIKTSPRSPIPSFSRRITDVAQGWSGTAPTYSTVNEYRLCEPSSASATTAVAGVVGSRLIANSMMRVCLSLPHCTSEVGENGSRFAVIEPRAMALVDEAWLRRMILADCA